MEKELRSGRSVPFVPNDTFLSQLMGIFLHYAVWHEKTGLAHAETTLTSAVPARELAGLRS